MVKSGILGRLEVINIAAHPEKAQEFGATSAPWIRIDQFEFTGLYTEKELMHWTEMAVSSSGFSAYFTHLIEIRKLDLLVRMIKRDPDRLDDLLKLLGNIEIPMAIRIGVGAAIEELQELNLLSPAAPRLIELTMSDQPQIRADACHYLGLTGDPEAIPAVNRLLTDVDREVREIAAETITLLSDTGQY